MHRGAALVIAIVNRADDGVGAGFRGSGGAAIVSEVDREAAWRSRSSGAFAVPSKTWIKFPRVTVAGPA